MCVSQISVTDFKDFGFGQGRQTGVPSPVQIRPQPNKGIHISRDQGHGFFKDSQGPMLSFLQNQSDKIK